LAVLFAAYPIEFYLQHRRLEEWMIYRFVVCCILGSCGLMLLLATGLTSLLASFGPRRQGSTSFWPAMVAAVLSGKSLWLLLTLLLAAAVFFLWPGFVEYWETRSLTLHWSRLIGGAFSLFSALQVIVFAFLTEVVSVWLKQVEQTQIEKPARRQSAIERPSEPIAS
jgi:hypothetical protein